MDYGDTLFNEGHNFGQPPFGLQGETAASSRRPSSPCMGGGLDALDGPREKIDMDSFIRKPAGEKAQVFKEAEERLSFAFCLIGDYDLGESSP